ncbi:Lactoylglutathione lyase [Diplonema papillatum]|nr:Lactoylglutathione lyase [Diplonema papillatum]
MQLARVVLRVQSPEVVAQFYVERFGMTATASEDGGEGIVLSFGGQDAAIALRPSVKGGYQHQRTDRYWKIGITLPNVDAARAQLCAAGVQVTEPKQFADIGYLCHLHDPAGFSIELLQHHFEGNRADNGGTEPVQPFAGARVGQVTLRVADLDASLAFYQDRLGMALLSVQPVPAYGFTLYFLAFTDEQPPNRDLKAVENREWLWQRPYTTLELQHFDDGKPVFALPASDEPGFAGLVITNAADRAERLFDDGGGPVDLLR